MPTPTEVIRDIVTESATANQLAQDDEGVCWLGDTPIEQRIDARKLTWEEWRDADTKDERLFVKPYPLSPKDQQKRLREFEKRVQADVNNIEKHIPALKKVAPVETLFIADREMNIHGTTGRWNPPTGTFPTPRIDIALGDPEEWGNDPNALTEIGQGKWHPYIEHPLNSWRHEFGHHTYYTVLGGNPDSHRIFDQPSNIREFADAIGYGKDTISVSRYAANHGMHEQFAEAFAVWANPAYHANREKLPITMRLPGRVEAYLNKYLPWKD